MLNNNEVIVGLLNSNTAFRDDYTCEKEKHVLINSSLLSLSVVCFGFRYTYMAAFGKDKKDDNVHTINFHTSLQLIEIYSTVRIF